MKKEPLGLYIIRILTGFGLLVFMAMLYWSSVLVEQDLKNVQFEIHELQKGVRQLQDQTDEIYDQIRQGGFEKGKAEPSSNITSLKNNPQIDPKLPNLLTEDQFYAETLPKMLGEGFKPLGTRKGATIGKPADLHPFANWNEVGSWVSQCSVSLARTEFGKYETMAPDMALKIEARPQNEGNIPEFWVHLRDQVFWEPLNERMFEGQVKLADHFKIKHQVTAEDYKFWFDAMMNPHMQAPKAVSLRNYLGDISEIEVIDPLTFIVRWTPKEVMNDDGELELKIRYVAKQMTGGLSPLASFVYKYFPDGTKIIEDDRDPSTYLKNSVWAQNFTNHWAKNIIPSCGPWVFEKMTDRQISFRRNPNHYFPLDVLVDRSQIQFKNTTDSVWQDFKAGELDAYNLQPDQLIELKEFLNSSLYLDQAEKGEAIHRLNYASRSYLYLGWNMVLPFFKNKKVRQALTMGIDRNRIIQQYLNGRGMEITGPFALDSPAYDKTIQPWPFDPQAAREILEDEGWYDSDGDGVIDKEIDGKRVPFQFSLTYFVKNPTTKSIAEYVVTALKELGIRVQLNGVDLADLSAVFDEKSFECLCLGWTGGTPPENPRQLWHSKGAKEPGSSNMVGFANKEVDQIIDRLDFEPDLEDRIELYHRFHRIIHQEQPYTFLYVPKVSYIYRDYLQNVFIPAERQDLIPGANVAEPVGSVFWLKQKSR